MKNSQPFLIEFFGVIFRGQTYLNLLYLLMAFPLGLFYFVLLVTGFSLGFGLLIVWVGVIILAGMLVAWWGCALFERQTAISLLHEDIPPMMRNIPAGLKTWDLVKSYLANPVTWKSLAYLLLKFPLGIITFVVLVTLLTLTLGFLTVPVTYQFFPIEILYFGKSGILIDTLWEAIACFFVGLVLLFPTLHILNGLARISGRFTKVMFS